MAKDLSAMANNNKSYMAKPGEVESKWYVVDATDMVLGRDMPVRHARPE